MDEINKRRASFIIEFVSVTLIGIFSFNYLLYINFDGYHYSASLNSDGAIMAPIPLIIVPSLAYVLLKLNQFKSDQSSEIISLKSQLRSQLEILYKLANFKVGSDARCTIHIPCKNNKYLQLLDYVGSVRYGEDRRREGIVGMSITKKKNKFVESFADEAQYRDCMIRKYNFKKENLAELSPNRFSYLCYPIYEGERVLGVVYYDSKMSDTFLYTKVVGAECGPYAIEKNEPTYEHLIAVDDELRYNLSRLVKLMESEGFI